jgi:outer membrane protein insertion porin family
MQLNIEQFNIGDAVSDGSQWITVAVLSILMMSTTGCANGKFGSLGSSRPIVPRPLAGDIPTPMQLKNQSLRTSASHAKFNGNQDLGLTPPVNTVAYRPQSQELASPAENSQSITVRAQSPDNNFWYGSSNDASNQGVNNAVFEQPTTPRRSNATQNNAAAHIPANAGNSGFAQQTAYQYPELSTQGRLFPPGNGLPSPDVGSPNQLNPLIQPFERGGNASIPYFPAADFADLDVTIAQTNTGRINIGGAFNSDNGIVGQFTVDEKDFDITRFPRNFGDIRDGTAFRGGGQQFRLELVPGQDIQRYLVSFTEPYFLNSDFSFTASGYLFDRRFFDYDENRLGGRFSFGRRLSPDLSITAGVRLERVEIDNPRLDTSQELNDNLGSDNLFLGNVGLVRDTRDHPFLPTEGSFFSATYTQAFGDFDYARGDLEYRRYRLIYQRPDRSGRHTISFGSKLGVSGDSTPIYENYFAGGFSTIRGFDFRGASPSEGNVRVGGQFQWLNTLEYMFPVTADDMIKGVLFCDFGTIERDIEIQSENFRVAPGFGFRVHMPAAGIGAPLAFDFAFPVSSAETDEERVFSFYLGVQR